MRPSTAMLLYSTMCLISSCEKEKSNEERYLERQAEAKRSQIRTQKSLTYGPSPKASMGMLLMAEGKTIEGIKLIREGVEDGEAEAMMHLGDAYFSGWGVEKDFEKGAEWLHKAIQLNHGSAAISLADKFCSGDYDGSTRQEVLQILKDARKLHTNVIDFKFARAKVLLSGKPTNIDYIDAYELLSIVAHKQDNRDYDLLSSPSNRNFVQQEKDWDRMVEEWDRMMGKQTQAMVMLGDLYNLGIGIPKDFAKGYMWFNLAASRGSAKALIKRNKMEEVAPPTSITLGQKLCSEWLEKHE